MALFKRGGFAFRQNYPRKLDAKAEGGDGEEEERRVQLQQNDRGYQQRNKTYSLRFARKCNATSYAYKRHIAAVNRSKYACPAWERSTHAKNLDPALNESCRCITGCLKPTNTNNLYILAGIAPPDIRRAVASRTEWRRQTTDERHPLHGHVPAPSRLKSRKSFLTSTAPLETTPSEARPAMWKEKLNNHPHSPTMHIPAAESLPPGDNNWAKWKCLNRLRSGVGRSGSPKQMGVPEWSNNV
ncbi:hypothetical protein AAFF_G00192550 [Aldrovandia affinis]|uniref:Uncharacterized protein n=1 Tax=Aldrovandia affinis TaxID=143900 RepID=A0AAD7RJ15_9TELE|nr:hypothetical protein AAFF_G00192550 [Aldrovandia affinis]